MTKNTEIVKKLYEASVDRDFDTVKSLVQPDYKLQDPMMNLNSAEELIDMMKSCPSGEVENLALVTEGDKVVATFDATMTEPVSARIRMCSIITMKNGKVQSEEMFYDTARVPKELTELMQQKMPSRKAG